jgi:hypothetical protein
VQSKEGFEVKKWTVNRMTQNMSTIWKTANRSTLKNCIFWDVAPCWSCVNRCSGDLYGATSHKTEFFTVTAVKTSNLTDALQMLRKASKALDHNLVDHHRTGTWDRCRRPCTVLFDGRDNCKESSTSDGSWHTILSMDMPVYHINHAHHPWTMSWPLQDDMRSRQKSRFSVRDHNEWENLCDP